MHRDRRVSPACPACPVIRVSLLILVRRGSRVILVCLGSPAIRVSPGNPASQVPQGPQGDRGADAVSPEAALMISAGMLTADEGFSVSGSGFQADEAVLLTVGEKIIGGGAGAQGQANAGGAFYIEFASMGVSVDAGPNSVRAEGGAGSAATIPVMVIDTAPDTTSPSSSLASTPISPGQDTTVYGAGSYLVNSSAS